MATVKHGTVFEIRPEGDNTLWLEVEAEQPLGFVGGQYVIVDSGKLRDNGKPGKRAYTILSADRNQRRLQFAVQRLPDCLCSGYMNRLKPGDRVAFSGPWGKFVWPEAESFQGTDPTTEEPTLVVASDTGITAALGFLSSKRIESSLSVTQLVWLRPEPHQFVSDDFVRDRLPAGLGGHTFLPCPPVGSPDRLVYARQILAEVFANGRPQRGYLCGDGDLNYGLMRDFEDIGVTVTKQQVESFFNSPKKKS